jgi:hypothetical protein
MKKSKVDAVIDYQESMAKEMLRVGYEKGVEDAMCEVLGLIEVVREEIGVRVKNGKEKGNDNQ